MFISLSANHVWRWGRVLTIIGGPDVNIRLYGQVIGGIEILPKTIVQPNL